MGDLTKSIKTTRAHFILFRLGCVDCCGLWCHLGVADAVLTPSCGLWGCGATLVLLAAPFSRYDLRTYVFVSQFQPLQVRVALILR